MNANGMGIEFIDSSRLWVRTIGCLSAVRYTPLTAFMSVGNSYRKPMSSCTHGEGTGFDKHMILADR